MNTKLYWLLRSWWKIVTFKIKKLLYSIRYKYENEKRTKIFSLLILKMIFKKLIFACIMCFISIQIDNILLNITKSDALDNQLFLDIIIGGIGVSGVILGLYCSNMASIFSSKYTNAPESIIQLYQQDILTNKCIKQIVGYITVCVVLLVVCIAEINFFMLLKVFYFFSRLELLLLSVLQVIELTIFPILIELLT